MDDNDKKLAWIMMYSYIVGIQHHPKNANPMTPAECAKKADQYMEPLTMREHRYKCHSG